MFYGACVFVCCTKALLLTLKRKYSNKNTHLYVCVEVVKCWGKASKPSRNSSNSWSAMIDQTSIFIQLLNFTDTID